MKDNDKNDKLAVLIDADNAQSKIVDRLLTEIAKYGTTNIKRAYGNWTSNELIGWKAVLLKHSIQPIQQFAYTTKKNATDSAMIIDAMDLLYAKNLDGFCIVSSDSDFTRLASRIREAGLLVYGFGEKKTPAPFIAACNTFIYTEVLRAEENEDEDNTITKKTTNELRQDTTLVKRLRNAVDACSDEDGWANLGPVGQNITKQAPDFDPRSNGYKKLSELVTATEFFDIEKRTHGIYIRDKLKK